MSRVRPIFLDIVFFFLCICAVPYLTPTLLFAAQKPPRAVILLYNCGTYDRQLLPDKDYCRLVGKTVTEKDKAFNQHIKARIKLLMGENESYRFRIRWLNSSGDLIQQQVAHIRGRENGESAYFVDKLNTSGWVADEYRIVIDYYGSDGDPVLLSDRVFRYMDHETAKKALCEKCCGCRYLNYDSGGVCCWCLNDQGEV